MTIKITRTHLNGRLGELNLEIPNKAKHSKTERDKFLELVREVLTEAKIGGNVKLKATNTQIRGSTDTKGLSLGSPIDTIVPLYYQSGDNGTRYQYNLCLYQGLNVSVHQLLQPIIGAAYLGKVVEKIVTPEKTDSRPDAGFVLVDEDVDTNFELPRIKPVEPPEDGYHNNVLWRTAFLQKLLSMSDQSLVKKSVVLEQLDLYTHYKQAFAGFGLVLGNLVLDGWLVTIDDDFYRVETDDPVSGRKKKRKSSLKSGAATSAPKTLLEKVNKIDRFVSNQVLVDALLRFIGCQTLTAAGILVHMKNFPDEWNPYTVGKILGQLVLKEKLEHYLTYTPRRYCVTSTERTRLDIVDIEVNNHAVDAVDAVVAKKESVATLLKKATEQSSDDSATLQQQVHKLRQIIKQKDLKLAEQDAQIHALQAQVAKLSSRSALQENGNSSEATDILAEVDRYLAQH